MTRATRNSAGHRAVEDPASSASDEKRFACTHPGCHKRFTRAEHVQRHALNHTAGQYTCLDCRAHFKRPDLLKRHMIRHRQKEKEADGPGNGVLNTRKRSWKTLAGEVVEKRPYPPGQAHQDNSLQQDLSTAQDELCLDNHSSTSGCTISTLVPSQPETDRNSAQNAASGFNVQYQQQSDGLPYGPALYDFPELSFYDVEHFQYEQTFQPDTASSFNMPYTTSLDYNWLFNDPNQMPVQQSPVLTFGATSQPAFVSTPESHQSRSAPEQQIQYAITPESLDSIENWVDPAIQNPASITGSSATIYNTPAVPPGGATPDTSPGRLDQESARKRIKPTLPKARLALLHVGHAARSAVLPDQEVWEAPDASSWAAAWRSSSSRDDKTSFLAALKSYLNQGLPRPAMLSGLSRVLLLHGLMSVAWDMQRREQTSLGVVSDPSSADNWRNSLSAAYDTWKLDFDAHFEASLAHYRERGRPEVVNEEEVDLRSFRTAYNAVYHAATALLNMDFLDIQIYAGSRHILGRPVQQKDYVRSSQVVKRWAATACPGSSNSHFSGQACASTATWHAARLLSEARESLPKSKAMGLFHVPWCLYLATLTCWAVHHARPGRNFGDDAYMDPDEIVWDPEGDMRVFVSNMANTGPRNTIQSNWQRGTTALAWVMADTLMKTRWGIIHAGAMVLRGLVPQRLINQYEEQT
ncbi:hypothetical protein O1611_g2014 [Lasiodiplodia mahajangana]|uniref:Uncharacterized protein n=1 Tax=Lasiodiplodia mahajangana TaxID=1108764 RepID=A0ACC2JVT1_9PEZI|nr:hypothetical protein O1611_g2014 [Lasiodiplodia mahajangana]